MILKVSKHSCRAQFVWLVSLVLFAGTAFADPRGPNPPHLIEVFTSAQYPVVETDAKGSGSHLQGPVITDYEIDGIQFVGRDLSLNLPVVPQPSTQIAMQRIQSLDEQTRSRMQASATALAKAMQYGINRYPAIVFDGQAVVYGVTDLQVALAHHESWRTELRP